MGDFGKVIRRIHVTEPIPMPQFAPPAKTPQEVEVEKELVPVRKI